MIILRSNEILISSCESYKLIDVEFSGPYKVYNICCLQDCEDCIGRNIDFLCRDTIMLFLNKKSNTEFRLI